MSVTTLILTIASILISAVAVGVLISTSSSLRETSQISAREADEQILTSPATISITATNGLNGTIEEIQHIIKLSPGSPDLRLDHILIYISSTTETASLTYKGVGSEHTNNYTNGFYTLATTEAVPVTITNTTITGLTEDTDLDGALDYIALTIDGYLQVQLSSGGNHTITAFNCSGAPQNISGTYRFPPNDYLDEVHVSGNCTSNQLSPNSVSIAYNNPGRGFYTAKYLRTGIAHQEGRVNIADVVELYYELPTALPHDEEFDISVIPKTGKQSRIALLTPEVISTQVVQLVP